MASRAIAASLAVLPRAIGVVGAGQMGSGIAQVAATHGLEVILCDTSKMALDSSEGAVLTSLSRLASSGKISQEDAEAASNRISRVSDLQALGSVDFVVEAASENEGLKNTIFQSLDKVAPSHCILATNTSSISITRLAAATSRPNQVIGMHWMNPPPVMGLIEIIRGMQTSDETFELTKALAEHVGKSVSISEDRPGFVVNRILMPMINEAFYTLMEGVATPEDIDKGMKLGTNQPMGPLALADLIGLDTCLSIMNVLQAGLGDCKYRPCPLLVQYVDAGYLGKKAGRGVYNYKTSRSKF